MLTGTLPVEMCGMSNLMSFLAAGNRLEGLVPPEWGGYDRGPSQLGPGYILFSGASSCVMKNLASINLSNNMMRCRADHTELCYLPVGLPHLVSLDLQGNRLEGKFADAVYVEESAEAEMPEEFSPPDENEFGLVSLNVANNRLTGRCTPSMSTSIVDFSFNGRDVAQLF